MNYVNYQVYATLVLPKQLLPVIHKTIDIGMYRMQDNMLPHLWNKTQIQVNSVYLMHYLHFIMPVIFTTPFTHLRIWAKWYKKA